MNYILYKTTNKVNQKIYVGVHKTLNLNDGYMGSGKVLRDAIAKYGAENFEREILETFDCAADMFAREAEIVTEEFLARNDVYNLRRGGFGGFDFINATPELTTKRNYKIWSIRRQKGNTQTAWVKGRKHTAESLIQISKKMKGKVSGFKGKSHTEETLQKMRLVDRSKEKNSQYGSFWINNGMIAKKHRGEIPDGWSRGRKIN